MRRSRRRGRAALQRRVRRQEASAALAAEVTSFFPCLTAKKSVTSAEKKLVASLTVLAEEYEAKHDPVPDAEPVAVIRHLMEAHKLRQKDLLDVFDTESIASEVLRSKRELTKQHIRRLSQRFQVSPAVFF